MADAVAGPQKVLDECKAAQGFDAARAEFQAEQEAAATRETELLASEGRARGQEHVKLYVGSELFKVNLGTFTTTAHPSSAMFESTLCEAR